ncbi:colicin immunity domain-containing protein [Sphaerisporangium sp. NPDC049002]|uniref:colicin immunity domain-containing protein n=1 Tax=unclassified Sphaerisporangium TaxID=2630420 RepID=UPI0033D35F06
MPIRRSVVLQRGPAWQGRLFDVLDGLFASVDDYCADQEILEQVGGLDDAGLRDAAERALLDLAEVGGHAG